MPGSINLHKDKLEIFETNTQGIDITSIKTNKKEFNKKTITKKSKPKKQMLVSLERNSAITSIPNNSDLILIQSSSAPSGDIMRLELSPSY